jgi:NADH-quinone oxidoreductase subunit J
MNIEAILFYFFAAILLLAALRVITARNPVHAALYLVLAFFTAAAIWMLLRAEFLAIVLVLVYVGAVMVLFLFVVMMLDINLDRLREGFWSYLGRILYTDYVYPFELAAVILLVAIVAAIALTLRRRKDTKRQDPAQQIAVKRADRVRLVSMPSEKKEG